MATIKKIEKENNKFSLNFVFGNVVLMQWPLLSLQINKKKPLIDC